jgi:uncharacterized protein
MRDLSDAELDELDALLAAAPAPLQALDVAMLDGYLCGVLVQPVLLEPAQWLAPVFDTDGAPLPDVLPPGWYERTSTLIQRHHDALNRRLVEDGGFDPIVFHLDSTDVAGADARAAFAPLWPWVGGFEYAQACFPQLLDNADAGLGDLLDRLWRYLPPEDGEDLRLIARLEQSHPVATLDEAIDDLVLAVVDLFDGTRDERYRVATVRRELPKVGRNQPCPCGSSRKFKQCHGA